MLLASRVQGQQAPILRCISLDNNDDVTLYWEQPNDTGADFNQILISYAQGNGAFTPVEQVTDFNQTSVLINGSFAQQGRFIIQQVYNGFADTSMARDTASPMVIGLSNQGKIVSLGWNPTGLPSVDSVFSVYKRNNGGNFNLHRTLDFPLTAMRDTTQLCEEDVAYRIEVNGVGGCISRSNRLDATIIDDLPPAPSNLIFASVDTATGNVDLRWKRSPSKDTYGYTIYYFEDFVRSDTVFGRGNITYTYDEFAINANLQPELLSIAPFDSCFDSLNGWYNQAPDSLRIQTLFIDTAGYDRCAGELILQWSVRSDSNIVVGTENVNGFHVYRKIQGEGSELIATLEPEDSIYIDREVEPGNKYTYVVAPFDWDNAKEALSNKLVVDLKSKRRPEYLYIKSIVNDHESGENEVRIYADTASETRSYGLFRSLSEESGYIEVERFSEDLADQMILTDITGEAEQSAFYYQVVAYDLCNEELRRSQVARSLHIEGEKSIRDLINTVEWNAYEGFDTVGQAISLYDLYRVTNDQELSLIYSTFSDYKYKDELVAERWISGEVCYFVEARQVEDGLYGIDEVAISNKRCFEYPPKVFIPTAFSPDNDGLNDVFLPNVNYIHPDAYMLQVYDRLGNLVFRTADPQSGWNGAGQPSGVYAYTLELANARGETLNYSGQIHLIR